MLFGQEYRLEMDTLSAGTFVGAVFVLPGGAWVGGLLREHLAVTPMSYLGFCKAMLKTDDSGMLQVIIVSLHQSERDTAKC